MISFVLTLGGRLGYREWCRVLAYAKLLGNILGRKWICKSNDAQGKKGTHCLFKSYDGM